MKRFSGNGAAQLFQYDSHAQLVEYLPGLCLRDLAHQGNDEEATHIFCDVVASLHKATHSDANLPDLSERLDFLSESSSTYSGDLLISAANQRACAIGKQERKISLLHGDLHHTNVLQSGRGWLAIDPQPCIGDDLYDVGNFFFNPDDAPFITESPKHILRHAEIIADAFEASVREVLDWAIIHGGISIAWQLQDKQNPSRRRRIMEAILDLTTKLKST